MNAIIASGGRAHSALGDLADAAGADAVCKQAHANGPINILVHNAGYYGHRNWTETTEEEWLAASRRFGCADDWSDIGRSACRDLIPNDVGQLGRPEEIAGAVAYLASSYADKTSDARFELDGGLNRSIP